MRRVIFIALTVIASVATAMNPTPNLGSQKAGDIILVKADDVPAYCDFKNQIVKIGYNKQDDMIFACVAIKGKRNIK